MLASEVIVVMGVAGSGKSTVAKALAAELSATFLDADDFHSPTNVAKMARGEALTDEDREGWLAALRARIEGALAHEERAVLACSALKRVYREKLGVGRPGVVLVYLKGSYELIRERVQHRTDHFFKEPMLASQFTALEEPTDAIVVDAGESPGAIVREIVTALEKRTAGA
jgi:gluconokinase